MTHQTNKGILKNTTKKGRFTPMPSLLPVFLKNDNGGLSASPFHKTNFDKQYDIRAKMYVLLDKKFFQYINLKNLQSGNITQNSIKDILPPYLNCTQEEVNNDFQFIMEYEDKVTHGNFINEEVTFYFRLTEEEM